jgi:hypothetical protein
MSPARRFVLDRDRLIACLLVLVLTVVYAYVFPRWADPNQDSRLKMVVAIVDDGTFRIDRYLGTTVDYARVGDHYYSDKAPGVAFLGVPVYWALRQLPIFDAVSERLQASSAFQSTLREDGAGVSSERVRFALAQVAIALVVGAIPSALIAALIFFWLRRATDSLLIRLTAALGYGLLTPVFAYANSMYGHQLAAALLFGAFVWISSDPAPRVGASALIGLMLGYAVVSEYPVAVVVVVLYGYAAWRYWRQAGAPGALRGLGPLSLTAAAVAAGWMSYNWAVFGGPLNLGYEYSELWQNQHSTGFMSLGLPRADALWGITFGVFRGLFVLAPWLLLAVPGLVAWWRVPRPAHDAKTPFGGAEWAVAVTAIVFMFVFNGSSIMWWGGFAVGPRYLLPALPFMAVFSAFVLIAARRRSGARWIWIGVALALVWSWVATWGLTLAEQAFPADTIMNPLAEFALPNWQKGNIARNVGTVVLGLRGPLSLVPLLIVIAAGVGGMALLGRRGDHGPGTADHVSQWATPGSQQKELSSATK